MTAVALLLCGLAALAYAPPPAGRAGEGPAGVHARRGRGGPGQGVDVVVVLHLLAAALRTGASIPRSLVAVGNASLRPGLVRAGHLLLLGASWEEAWEGESSSPVARSLEPAWRDGANPLPLLERAAAALRSRRQHAAQQAAARLGVRLVLPLGLCHLPAFILVGIVPVLLSAGMGLE